MDSVILSQTDGTNTMYFQYDDSGVPIGFIYNDIQILYRTNQNGDVIALVSIDGTVFANYKYDAWGKTISIDLPYDIKALRDIAEANPLRYRGYYLDSETGYYYLQSRYYDPNICRFINADIVDIAYGCRDEAIGTNLFAYCCNNPISYIDLDGCWKSAVHNGYNPNTSTKYNNVKVNNKTYFYGTYYWAIQCGFSKPDARSLAEYCSALDQDYVLRMLGYGLHAIQDMCAHGQIGRGKDIPEHVTSVHTKYADTVINYVWTSSAKNSFIYVIKSISILN